MRHIWLILCLALFARIGFAQGAHGVFDDLTVTGESIFEGDVSFDGDIFPAPLVYDFPIIMVQDIGFDFGFTALGLVPYAQFDTASVDTATAFLQYRVPALYLGSIPSIIFEWVASDTMFAGDTLNFTIYQVQAEPGVAASVDTTFIDIVVEADTLAPGYNISDTLFLAATSASSNNLVITRPTADDYPGVIGILGWTISIPRVN